MTYNVATLWHKRITTVKQIVELDLNNINKNIDTNIFVRTKIFNRPILAYAIETFEPHSFRILHRYFYLESKNRLTIYISKLLT